MQSRRQREIHASASCKTMLLDFGLEIRSCDRLEVGRIARLTCCCDKSQLNIVLNWCFTMSSFLATAPAPENNPICIADLFPTCINFEFESVFSTTCPQNSRNGAIRGHRESQLAEKHHPSAPNGKLQSRPEERPPCQRMTSPLVARKTEQTSAPCFIITARTRSDATASAAQGP